MSFEPAAGVAAEPAPPGLAGTGSSEPVPLAIRVQIMSTEHWSLLASRSLAWNEVFARAGMHLSALTGSIVALALVGQGSGFGLSFLAFGIVILPVVLFIGLTTVGRLGTANYYDAQCVIGMNRIRAGYLEIAPDLARFFVMSAHDDPRGIGTTMGFEPDVPQIVRVMTATPMVVAVLNGVVAGAIAGFVLLALGVAPIAVLLAAGVVFALVLAGHARYAAARVRALQAGVTPMFPSPPGTPGPEPLAR